MKKILIIFVGVTLIVYAGYKMNILPIKVVEEGKEELQEKLEIIADENRDEGKSLLRRVFDGLDSGKESKESKTEISDASDFEKSLESFLVTEIVDGDTIWVKNDTHPNGIKVRYIGIDTPESVHEDASKNTSEGKIAANRNEEILDDAMYEVYLEYDAEREDQYGRTLAYVYIYNWDTESYEMVQDVLLSEGMGRLMTIQPNSKYADHFYELEVKAREDKQGFWGTGFYK